MTSPALPIIRAQVETFPALPATVSRVMAITANPESSANDLMQAILPDQSMCTTILKIANSTFFGMPRQISSIERAVVVLGQEEIRNIILGKALFTAFPKMARENRQRVSLFWEHAFTCGLAAKIIADHFRLSPSEFFIAGLIHDIGKLALLLTFPDDYPLLREFASPNHFFHTGEEQQQFGISHDEVGRLLAEKWHLPEQLIMATGYHHNPQLAPNHRHYPVIVQVADILSLMYCCAEISGGSDVETIFTDFLPETATLWAANGLHWQSGDLQHWFGALQQKRVEEEEILKTLTAR
jgi:HD-like signal output (HDOD) protein